MVSSGLAELSLLRSGRGLVSSDIRSMDLRSAASGFRPVFQTTALQSLSLAVLLALFCTWLHLQRRLLDIRYMKYETIESMAPNNSLALFPAPWITGQGDRKLKHVVRVDILITGNRDSSFK